MKRYATNNKTIHLSCSPGDALEFPIKGAWAMEGPPTFTSSDKWVDVIADVGGGCTVKCLRADNTAASVITARGNYKIDLNAPGFTPMVLETEITFVDPTKVSTLLLVPSDMKGVVEL